MRRRAKPAKAKVEGKRPPTLKGSKTDDSRVRDLEMRLAEALKDKAETLDQQTATSEILRVISQAPGDLQPVLTAVAQNAARLCDARDVAIVRLDGGSLRMVAGTGAFSEMLAPDYNAQDIPGTRGSVTGRAITDRMTIHVHDLAEESEAEYPHGRALQKRYGHRTMLAIPLLREGLAIGAISICRFEVRPFSESQIALLQTFADQAVIAIENARLFKELQEKNGALTEAHAQVTESLEQQTATGEVLKVISRSAFDVQPVFDTIAESAVRLCGAERAFIFRFDGELLRAAASYNAGADLRAFVDENPIRPGQQTISARAALERRTVHIADVQADTAYSYAMRDVEPIRTVLAVPMLKGDELVGTITIYRLEANPFAGKQVALVETFADQAVIAIENVRLFTELQASNRELTTALDTQTATSDILRVISGSRTDVQPVFDAIVTSAVRLLGGYSGGLTQVAGERIELAAQTSIDDAGDAALRASFPRLILSQDPNAEVISDRAPLNIADAHHDPRLSEAARVAARVRGYRGVVIVPLLRRDEAIGTLGVTRREPGGFTDDEIALLKTFADQAVIAIENVRLFKALEASNAELTESLAQQTATSEILRTIAHAQTDTQPVFDTIVRSAARLCHAANAALFLTHGGMLYEPANYDSSPEALAATRARYPRPVGMDTIPGMAVLTRSVIHVPDTEDPSAIEHVRQRGRLLGFRGMVTVPMLREGEPVGAIIVTHRDPGLFSDAEVELRRSGRHRRRECPVVQGAGGPDRRPDTLGRAAHCAGGSGTRRQLHARSRNRADHHCVAGRPAVGAGRRCGLRVRRGRRRVRPTSGYRNRGRAR